MEFEKKKPIVPGYTILKELGSGGCSRIYLGMKKGKEYVIKIFNETYSEHSRMNEINVNLYLGFLHRRLEGGFITEYNSGMDLFEILNRFPPKKMCVIMLEIVREVKKLHSKKIAHLDIKPENITINQHGEVSLIDYGFSRTWDEGISLKYGILMHKERECMGSTFYISPEMIKRECRDVVAADIYSLGITLYSLIESKYPFDGDGKMYMNNVLNREPLIISNQKYSEELRSEIMKMISRDPEKRPPLVSVENILLNKKDLLTEKE